MTRRSHSFRSPGTGARLCPRAPLRRLLGLLPRVGQA